MKTKIIFLDRDGVLNRFPGRGAYVTRAEDFVWIPGSREALSLLTRSGFEIYIVSNQGCVSRKLISRETLSKMTNRFLAEAKEVGGVIREVLYCPHQSSDHCECKKPKTALFEEALQGQSVDRSSIFFVGDSPEDLLAGERMGFKTILVLSGRTLLEEVEGLQTKPTIVHRDLLEAARWITQKKS